MTNLINSYLNVNNKNYPKFKYPKKYVMALEFIYIIN